MSSVFFISVFCDLTKSIIGRPWVAFCKASTSLTSSGCLSCPPHISKGGYGCAVLCWTTRKTLTNTLEQTGTVLEETCTHRTKTKKNVRSKELRRRCTLYSGDPGNDQMRLKLIGGIGEKHYLIR